MILWLISLILAMVITPLASQEVYWKSSDNNPNFSAEIKISNSRISLDQELNIGLLLRYPIGYDVDPWEIDSHLMQGFNPLQKYFLLVSTERKAPVIREGKVSQEIHYTLEPIIDGTYLISFLNIDFKPEKSNEKRVTIYTDVFEIGVSSATSSAQIPKIMAGPLSLSNAPPITISDKNREILENATNEPERNAAIFQNKKLPLKIYSALAILCLIAFLLKNVLLNYWRKRFAPVPLTPQERALVHLETLNEAPLSKKEDYESFYVDLTNTIRQYIEERYQIRAPHFTTQEFLLKAKESAAFDESDKKRLRDFLDYSDMVKFAEYQPTQYDCQKALEIAKNFIH